jgi:hypothetical protein
MTDAQIELSRRAAACKGWQWMPGMRTINGRRLAVVFGASRTAAVLCDLRDDANSDTEELQGELPDLTDPATAGCLLALVREVWSDPYLCVVGDPDTGWRVDAVTAQVQDLHGYRIEAEAFVAALEAAP